MASNALLIFLKNPEKGYVKTRIAESVGSELALKIYLYLLQYTQKVTLQLDYPDLERYLFYSRFIAQDDEWPALSYHKKLQLPNADLGRRMEDAFQTTFAQQYKRVVLIGSDCPYLSPDILKNAFDCLNNNDCVLGPVADGGYYLLGFRQACYSSVFYAKQWSTNTVAADTLSDLRQGGKSVALLPLLGDIDTYVDWEHYINISGLPNV